MFPETSNPTTTSLRVCPSEIVKSTIFFAVSNPLLRSIDSNSLTRMGTFSLRQSLSEVRENIFIKGKKELLPQDFFSHLLNCSNYSVYVGFKRSVNCTRGSSQFQVQNVFLGKFFYHINRSYVNALFAVSQLVDYFENLKASLQLILA